MEKGEENFRHIVRISNTDLDGNKKVIDALRKVKGVGFSFANALCVAAGIPKYEKTGYLSDSEIAKLESAISGAVSKLPAWMLNRRRDVEGGSPSHLVATNLTFAQENDVRQMQRIRSYRGVRHMAGAPVRGQRTRSNFRRNKGRAMGVAKPKTGKKQ